LGFGDAVQQCAPFKPLSFKKLNFTLNQALCALLPPFLDFCSPVANYKKCGKFLEGVLEFEWTFPQQRNDKHFCLPLKIIVTFSKA
jgi:hypothetical protein